ncbi:MAG: cation transporter [Oscillospiraceae bacterium]|nr:cation transporter [Oscillospiraceae bacterium]
MEKLLKIEGMMCGHCSARVKKALEAVPGVESAQVSHEKGEASVLCAEAVTEAALREAVENQGFDVVQ